jgi:dienelactone hydrolase
MRIDVAFDADGTRLRGWLYTPDEGAGPVPIVVMAHGFSALKEMGLDQYAEVFARAGLAALVYDNRNLGASEGNPRFEIDPIAQMRDYRHAITYAQTRPEVRPDRIGVWGTSYSGGLVMMVAALDRRVKCVVSQVPFISGYETMVQVMPLEEREQFYDRLQKERLSLAAGNPPSLVAVCTNDTSKPINAPGRRTYRYFQSFTKQNNLNWENKVTLRSLDYRLEYEACRLYQESALLRS